MADPWWNELIEFIANKTSISRRRIERILDIYTPEAIPPSLQEVIRDILAEKKTTKEGVNPLTQYDALRSLIDLEAEQSQKEALRLEEIFRQENTSEETIREVPELFLRYSNLIEEICSKTGEEVETIHQVHRAYLQYVYLKTNNPDTLIPFLKWYLKRQKKNKGKLNNTH